MVAPFSSAETLFASRTIAEIREASIGPTASLHPCNRPSLILEITCRSMQAEAKTRHDIEEKKQALREVVGSSYRELISSADTILEIAASCRSVNGLVEGTQVVGTSSLWASRSLRYDEKAHAWSILP